MVEKRVGLQRVAHPTESIISILIIDNDQAFRLRLKEYLLPYGFMVSGIAAKSDGVQKMIHGDFQAILLAVEFAGLNNFELLRTIRRSSALPVLMLTAQCDETDCVVALESGADDFLIKSCSLRMILARMRALLRRYRKQVSKVDRAMEITIHEGELRINPSTRTVIYRHQVLSLTPVEFDLLLNLARSAGRVLSREQLLHQVCRRDYDVYDRAIDVHISSLRRKLDDEPHNPRFIKTVRASGYMLIDKTPPGPPFSLVTKQQRGDDDCRSN